jgi:hypothetical protein
MREKNDPEEDLRHFEDRASWVARHTTQGAVPPFPVVTRVPELDPLDREKARANLIVALEVALAIILLLLVVIFLPRPEVRVTNVRFEETLCNQVTSSFVVTAYLSLMNTGGADGTVYIRFYVDDHWRGTEPFVVPARTTIHRSMSVTIVDCSPHRYSVEPCFPSGEGGSC